MNHRNKDLLALLAKNIAVEMHAHHAVQMVISLDKSYPATLDGREFSAVRGFLIDSDIAHACQSAESNLLVISVDAETVKGRRLKRLLAGTSFRLVEEILPADSIEDFAADYRQNSNDFDFTRLLNILIEDGGAPEKTDERVSQTVRFITENISAQFKISDIARRVDLSESRLRHLFTEQTGIAPSSFILWTRIKIALREMLAAGSDLTETAHAAGFADHAHFTRIFRRMFGIPPSLLVKNVECLQVFDL